MNGKCRGNHCVKSKIVYTLVVRFVWVHICSPHPSTLLTPSPPGKACRGWRPRHPVRSRAGARAAVRGSAVYLDPCDSLRSHARFPLTITPSTAERSPSLKDGGIVFECQCVGYARDDEELLILRCTFCRCVSFFEADDQWSPLRRTNGSNHAEHVYHQPRGCISSMRTHCISSRVA